MSRIIWEWFFGSSRKTQSFEQLDCNEAKSSLKEIIEIAKKHRLEAKWYLVEPRNYNLCKDIETKRLYWTVKYLLEVMQEDYITGTMGYIRIDDETKEIVSESYIPH